MAFVYELELRGGNHDGLVLELTRPGPLGRVCEFRWPCCGQLYQGETDPRSNQVQLRYVPPVVPAAFEAAFTQYPR